MADQITLTLASLAAYPLVFELAPDGSEDFVLLSKINPVEIGDPTPVIGVPTFQGYASDPFCVWSFNVVLTDDYALFFDKLAITQQQGYQADTNAYATLEDERNYFSDLECTLNSRSIISGSTVATFFGDKSYIATKVFLRIPQNHSQPWGQGYRRVQFDAVELP